MKTLSTSVTLTSKHQLTVPIKMVRKLKLQPGDRFMGTIKNGAIVLKPRPTISQELENLWADSAKRNKGVASDASIKESVRNYYRSQKRP